MRADQDHSGVAILPLSPTHRTALALTIAGACFLSPTLAGRVQARDDAGVHPFVAHESRRSAGPSAYPAPSFAFRAPRLGTHPYYSFRRRASRAPKVTFANLPRSEPLVRKRRTKPVAVEAESKASRPTRSKADIADPVSALLRDKTLQAGDIVVLPDGPRSRLSAQ